MCGASWPLSLQFHQHSLEKLKFVTDILSTVIQKVALYATAKVLKSRFTTHRRCMYRSIELSLEL